MDHKDLTSAFYLKTNKFVYKYSKFINCKDDKKLNMEKEDDKMEKVYDYLNYIVDNL